ncbi:hypothetical protein [Flavobacterium sp.]|uniref:hypothetical protein n=1 Tax=Flavobacterium sp. TaxID=239 RepID=UPI002627331B|nr:hypothetical protein [Flavobacterium sp.]
MKSFFGMACFFVLGMLHAQPPEFALTPNGFDAVTVDIPATSNEKLISLTKNWAQDYNRTQEGSDISNVTQNSITITAYKKNAFNYGNRGENFYHKIKYDIRFEFNQSSYTVSFNITEIYLDDVLLEYKLPDYFTSEGKLKDGYNTLDVTLEDTVNDIVNSHYDFIMNYR